MGGHQRESFISCHGLADDNQWKCILPALHFVHRYGFESMVEYMIPVGVNIYTSRVQMCFC